MAHVVLKLGKPQVFQTHKTSIKQKTGYQKTKHIYGYQKTGYQKEYTIYTYMVLELKAPSDPGRKL